MVALRTLMMLIGALAVLMLGAVAAPATAEAAPPPCHEMAGHAQGSEGAPPSELDKPMRAMACCVACVAAPAIQPPGRAALPAPLASPSARLAALPVGQTLTPEPGPPRLNA